MSASARLARLLTKQEHLLWAERVKPHLPRCASVHNNLVQHGRGLVSHDAFYVLRDRPHSAAVLSRNEIIPHTQHIGVFCLKEEVGSLIEGLRSTPVIDWEGAKRNDLVILHIPPYAADPLVRLAQERGVRMRPTTGFTFTYDAHLDPHTLRVPAGFRVCRLGRAGICHLMEKAQFGGTPLDLILRMAEDLPYIGVFQDPTSTQEATVDPLNLPVAGDEEIPVACCCSNPAGEIANLITDERFKRRGFKELVVATLARRQVALLGFIPHGYSEVNKFENSPGWSMTHETTWITKICQGSV